jgi:thiol-disulfide isomerase/thioredoxin
VKALLFAMALAACGHAARPTVSRIEPGSQLIDPASKAPFSVAQRYRGRVVVLDFWASWCEQCRETVPQVSRLAQAFAGQGLVVVGVNEGDRPGDAEAAAKTFGIGYPIALDLDLLFAEELGATGLPTLVVLDADGNIAHRAKHVDEETLAIVRTLLSAAPRSPAPPSPDASSPLPAPPPP